MGKMRAVCLWLGLALLLAGCKAGGDSRMEDALAFRAHLLGGAGCSFAADITADYGDQVYRFSVACTTDSEGTLSFAVTAPETIAGIAGTVSASGGKLTFEDTALDFGLLADGKVSPVTASYVMEQSWRTGYITAVGQDDDGLRLTVDATFEENPLTVDTWLDTQKRIPIFAEVCYNGQRILTISVSEFQFLS